MRAHRSITVTLRDGLMQVIERNLGCDSSGSSSWKPVIKRSHHDKDVDIEFIFRARLDSRLAPYRSDQFCVARPWGFDSQLGYGLRYVVAE